MRLGTVRIHGGAPRAVGLVDGHVIDLGEAAFDLGLIGTAFPCSVRELLELKPYTDPLIADLERAVLGRDDAGSAPWAYSLDEVTFSSPVAPGKVLLVGGNHQGSQTQPPGASLGSMFKNPPGDYAGRLIDAAGLKGTQVGGVMISPVHANFFINVGGGTSADYLNLIRLARRTVQGKFGISLELEIELVGEGFEDLG